MDKGSFVHCLTDLVAEHFPELGASEPHDVADLLASLTIVIGSVMATIGLSRGEEARDGVYKFMETKIKEHEVKVKNSLVLMISEPQGGVN